MEVQDSVDIRSRFKKSKGGQRGEGEERVRGAKRNEGGKPKAGFKWLRWGGGNYLYTCGRVISYYTHVDLRVEDLRNVMMFRSRSSLGHWKTIVRGKHFNLSQ